MQIIPNQDELDATTGVILRNPDKVAEWLNLADKYMQSYVADPKIFLLPSAHKVLTAIIATYANNLEGFIQYIIEARDSFDKSSSQWLSVQRVYRRVNGRHVQQVRRERSYRAIEKATELFGPIEYHARLQWVSDLEHEWAQRRLLFLDGQRASFKNDRIPATDRIEMLFEFWNDIDTEIFEGKIPNWNLKNHGATQR